MCTSNNKSPWWRVHERAWSGSGEGIERQSLAQRQPVAHIHSRVPDWHMPAVTNLKGLVSLSESSDMVCGSDVEKERWCFPGRRS